MASALPAETPAPFPVSAQYVRALRDVDHGELAEEIVSAPASKPKQAKGRGRCKGRKAAPRRVQKKVKPATDEAPSDSSAYVPHLYGEKRMLFIASNDLPHAAASKAWLHSQERKTLLSKLSVKELLRRRFVPPGTRVNPFAE